MQEPNIFQAFESFFSSSPSVHASCIAEISAIILNPGALTVGHFVGPPRRDQANIYLAKKLIASR